MDEKPKSNDPRNNIKMDSISFADDSVDAGDILETSISIENIGEDRLDDVSVTISIPELGIWVTTAADDIRDGQTDKRTIALEIPADVAPGVYDVRIIVSNDDMKRIKHRDITIN